VNESNTSRGEMSSGYYIPVNETLFCSKYIGNTSGKRIGLQSYKSTSSWKGT